MSQYYKSNRQLGLYETKTEKAFKISRLKIDSNKFSQYL